ncbi:hypothetical protein ABPG74_001417 [Tetrahymena malaccensis]
MNYISEKGASHLGVGIGSCKNLTNLSITVFSKFKIGKDGACGIGNGIGKCLSLEKINNDIGYLGSQELGVQLKKCNNLINLIIKLSYNKIGTRDTSFMLNELSKCHMLESLSLDNYFYIKDQKANDQNSNKLISLCKEQIGFQRLKTLNLHLFLPSGIDIGQNSCTNMQNCDLYLFEPQQNFNLLDNSENEIIRGFKQCANLFSLNITLNSRNIFTDDRINSFCQEIMNCDKLKKLEINLSEIGLTAQQVLSISNSLRNLNDLKTLSLNLNENLISQQAAIQLGIQLSKCQFKIIGLDISGNSILEGYYTLKRKLFKIIKLIKLSLLADY